MVTAGAVCHLRGAGGDRHNLDLSDDLLGDGHGNTEENGGGSGDSGVTHFDWCFKSGGFF